MLKKIILVFLLLFINFGFTLNNYTFAEASQVNCIGLPGCEITTNDGNLTSEKGVSKNIGLKWTMHVIAEGIKYVAVLAVLSLIISGFFYIFSGGEDEKTKKAKRMITWSLIGVLISMSAWGIISMVNKINI